MALLGDGVNIAYEGGSPADWIELTDLLDLPMPPAPVADKLETTVHGTDGYKTYGLGLRDVPDITATFQFEAGGSSATAHLAMIAALEAQTELTWLIEVPSNTAKTLFINWQFTGYVNKADISTPINGWQTMTLGIMYSGSYAFTSTPAATKIT